MNDSYHALLERFEDLADKLLEKERAEASCWCRKLRWGSERAFAATNQLLLFLAGGKQLPDARCRPGESKRGQKTSMAQWWAQQLKSVGLSPEVVRGGR